MIVDDEAHARRNLELALVDFPDWRLAASCDNTTSAESILARHDIDLVLLDIKMPGQSGLDLARTLCLRPRPPIIAFVTAYEEHALDAFDLFAIDYILKPFDDQRFAALIARARTMLDIRRRVNYSHAVENFVADQSAARRGQQAPHLSYISVRSIGSIERIPVDEVDMIKSAGSYVELHLSGRIVMHRCSMNALETRLPLRDFIRLHRTAIARRTILRRLLVHKDHTYSVEISGGRILPVSPRYISDIRKLLA